MLKWLRNCWRGYANADVISLQQKLAQNHKPGAMVQLTAAEVNAMRSGEMRELIARELGEQ